MKKARGKKRKERRQGGREDELALGEISKSRIQREGGGGKIRIRVPSGKTGMNEFVCVCVAGD